MKIKYTSKKILTVIAICLIFSSLLSFASCTPLDSDNKGNDEEIIYHTVTFNSVGGNEISPMRVKHGSAVNQPVTPVRENYIFIE